MNWDMTSRIVRASRNVDSGVWFFGAFFCLMAWGYLDVMSKALASI
jgi:hypothetical protein